VQEEGAQSARPYTKKTVRAEKQKPVIYAVKKGNKVEAIAGVFGVEANDIRKWNRIKSSKLVAGQKLTIYPAKPIETVNYTVKKGDTITDISETFKVRPSFIVTCNGLNNGWNIKAGQTLTFYRMTDKKPVLYAVKKGATLTQIASRHNVKVKDIVMWNNLNSATVYAGQKRPNGLGIYDMSGNVWEWVADYWKDTYSSSSQTNPKGPDSVSSRVLRGGSWYFSARFTRAAFRVSFNPDLRSSVNGFRLARTN